LKSRTIPDGEEGAGTRIDQSATNTNPLYAAEGSSGSRLEDTPVDDFWGQHGWRYTDETGKLQKEDALLKDEAKLSASRKESSQRFETTALALTGEQEGAYYGSVQWGWQKDASGKVVKLPLTLVSSDAPSAAFAAATALWNKGMTSEGKATLDLPIVTARYIGAGEVELVGNPAKQKETVLHKLTKNTRVEVTGQQTTWSKVTVVDGTHIGSVGWLMSLSLSEKKSP
jgi:hypothetical protein